MSAAVDARILSSMKSERVLAAKALACPNVKAFAGDRKEFIKAVHDALYCSKIMSYAQGMALIKAASQEYKWDLKLGEIAALWKGGCIIRARFLDDIRKAFDQNPNLDNLVLDSFMKKEVERTVQHLRDVISVAANRGIPTLAFSASLAYFDSYRLSDLPQNLTQAQRDFFGAHTYERKDKTGVFHSEWEA
jgi:6-phosphogluconate dehydrogenase